VVSRGHCWKEIKRRGMDARLVFFTKIPPVLVGLFMGKWSRRKGALRTIPPSTQGVTQLSYQEQGRLYIFRGPRAKLKKGPLDPDVYG
jgi:hypothetical protein